MSTHIRNIPSLLSGVALAMLIVAGGCRRKEETKPAPAPGEEQFEGESMPPAERLPGMEPKAEPAVPEGVERMEAPPLVGVAADRAPAEIRQFHQQVQTMTAPGADLGKQQSSQLLRQLADALEVVPDAPAEAIRAAQDVRMRARQVEETDDPTDHTELIKSAFDKTADALDKVREQHPQMAALAQHVQKLRESSKAIEDGTRLGEQRDRIVNTFKAASNALLVASTRPTGREEKQPYEKNPPQP